MNFGHLSSEHSMEYESYYRARDWTENVVHVVEGGTMAKSEHNPNLECALFVIMYNLTQITFD